MRWLETVEERLVESFNRHVKYDIFISVALIAGEVEYERRQIDNWIRNTDILIPLDSKHALIFYEYTDIEEAHYAIKNLYGKLCKRDEKVRIVCTEVKPKDRDPANLLRRLCALNESMESSDQKYVAQNRIEEGVEIFDVDFSDI